VETCPFFDMVAFLEGDVALADDSTGKGGVRRGDAAEGAVGREELPEGVARLNDGGGNEDVGVATVGFTLEVKGEVRVALAGVHLLESTADFHLFPPRECLLRSEYTGRFYENDERFFTRLNPPQCRRLRRVPSRM
jgi:hypothetical protein